MEWIPSWVAKSYARLYARKNAGCCPCTDPANAGKVLGLVCNCRCHGTTFCHW